ncbi:MAG: metallophosphoesterase [Acidobacteriia bacterium]|nr:metallophosphoesterase [Terriglobia bacterium]
MKLISGWLLAASLLAQNPSWKFAVSGDSRNCGGIVMPAIAAGVRTSGADFYWHLGDFRAIYMYDEDLVPPPKLGLPSRPLSILNYESMAWPDFIARQIKPFGSLPVFLALGNHELYPPFSRDAWLIQFADWLEQPVLREQRLKDDPADHKLHGYYHWINHGVDFITLDNASADQFDGAQLRWIHSVIDRDEASQEIRSIVVGMHEALPGSVSRGHSMSESAQGERSGREVYQSLWHAQNSAHKHVYVLASHSHFYMEDIFDTPDWKGKVLPGWIVGTAGAVRYRLPSETGPSQNAVTDVYGYLLGSVSADGAIAFAFQKLSLDDLRAANAKTPEPLVRWCFEENKQ